MILAQLVLAATAVAGPLADSAAAPPAPTQLLEPFPLRDVRILEGPFLDMQKRGLDYLLSLDPDRLLHTFRINAGLPTSAAPYGGWARTSSCAGTASATTSRPARSAGRRPATGG
jgi:uncharacterized protein